MFRNLSWYGNGSEYVKQSDDNFVFICFLKTLLVIYSVYRPSVSPLRIRVKKNLGYRSENDSNDRMNITYDAVVELKTVEFCISV